MWETATETRAMCERRWTRSLWSPPVRRRRRVTPGRRHRPCSPRRRRCSSRRRRSPAHRSSPRGRPALEDPLRVGKSRIARADPRRRHVTAVPCRTAVALLPRIGELRRSPLALGQGKPGANPAAPLQLIAHKRLVPTASAAVPADGANILRDRELFAGAIGNEARTHLRRSALVLVRNRASWTTRDFLRLTASWAGNLEPRYHPQWQRFGPALSRWRGDRVAIEKKPVYPNQPQGPNVGARDRGSHRSDRLTHSS